MDAEGHRTEAVEAYNRAWELLGTEHAHGRRGRRAAHRRLHLAPPLAGGGRRPAVDRRRLDGVACRRAPSGLGELALLFAERAYGAALEDGTDWLEASAAEGVARAFAAAGDLGQRDAWCAVAVGLVTAIGNKENRAVVAGQLAETAGYRPP